MGHLKFTDYLKYEITCLETSSAWNHGVLKYALDLAENLEKHYKCNPHYVPQTEEELREIILSGTRDFEQYSNAGMSLTDKEEVIKRLCGTSMSDKYKSTKLEPNEHEDWYEVQARALNQAYRVIVKLYRRYDFYLDSTMWCI